VLKTSILAVALGVTKFAELTPLNLTTTLSGVYTGKKTLYVVAVASDSNLKRWEDFY
jgi:hypothetical protein